MLKRVGLLGIALIGGGFTLNLVVGLAAEIEEELDSFVLLALSLDDVDDRAGDATEAELLPALLAPAEALLLDEDEDED